MSRLVATWFFVGYLRPAPGTWGSLAAIPCAWIVHVILGFPGLMGAIVIVFCTGWWAVADVTHGGDDHDPPEIVVDEIVGQWIALCPLSARLWFTGQTAWFFPAPECVMAFLLFRLFDIWKPGPAGWADRRRDAFGVMADDAIAGLFSAVAVGTVAAIGYGGLP